MSTLSVQAPDGKTLDIDVTGADPSKYSQIAEEAVNTYLNNSQGPSALKSGAVGVMSGIPGAEAATAGIESVVNQTPFAQEHQNLENLKNQAWQQHPVAYGAGKAAGLVGTGLVAPEGIPGAIGVGAASGLDTVSNISDLPAQVAKGAATGAVLGVAGSAISNALPGVAKGAVASLIPGNAAVSPMEAVEARLANPETIQNAISPVGAAEKLASGVNTLSGQTREASQAAQGLLNPATSPITSDTIQPIFDDLKNKFMVEGTAVTPEKQAAINVLDNLQTRISSIAQANGGQIPEDTLGQIVREIQDSTKTAAWGNPEASEAQGALKQLSGQLNSILKTSNPSYQQAMAPVAEQTGLLKDVADKFGLNTEGNTNGYTTTPSETTNTKMANVLKEGKTESQQFLEQMGNLTGFDFLGNAKAYATKEAFENAGQSSDIKNLMTMTGYGVGHMTGIPGGGILGAAAGRIIGGHIDGGAIAAGIIDKYLNLKTLGANTGVSDALKTFGPVLVNAAKAGGNQLAATHFVLSTSNPQYQQLVQQTQNQ